MGKSFQEKSAEIIEAVDEIVDTAEPEPTLESEQGQEQEPTPDVDGNKKGSNRRILIVSLIIAAIIVFSFLSVYFIINSAIASGTTTLMNSYNNSFKEAVSEIRQEVKDAVASYSENIYHIENYITINVGGLRECSNLEVLKIRESDINIVNGASEFNTTSWLEVIETCEYVVDLTSAEFIIDNVRGVVTVRLPDPEVRNFNVEKYIDRFDHSSFLTSTKKAGEELINKQIQESDAIIRATVLANQNYFNNAKDSAVNMVTNAIKTLNSEIDNLQIIVEFIND